MTTLADLRINYSRASLDEADVAHDPFAQFDRWFKEALDVDRLGAALNLLRTP